jgi:hypothetical protein
MAAGIEAANPTAAVAAVVFLMNDLLVVVI